MLEKTIEKLISRTPLVIVVIGVVMFIIGASGSFPIGNPPVQIVDLSGRISLGIIGFILVAVGLLFVWREEFAAGGIRQFAAKGDEMPLKFYTFCGLDEITRSEDVFQDFDIKRPGGNINAVYYLWADTYKASSINAFVNSEERFLRISFNNEPGCYPGNIAIRPKAEQALANTLQKPYLAFEARIPREASQNSRQLEKVSIVVRIVNGWLQYWVYEDKPGESIQFLVEGSEWRRFSVDLRSTHWYLFHSDGNVHYGPKNAEFSIVSGVILELGSYNVPGRPGPGEGMVDIREIRLADNA
jgi:hypothetical protein